MAKPLNAIYHDGQVDFEGKVDIPEGSRLSIVVIDNSKETKPFSSLRAISKLKLKGPEDASTNYKNYIQEEGGLP